MNKIQLLQQDPMSTIVWHDGATTETYDDSYPDGVTPGLRAQLIALVAAPDGCVPIAAYGPIGEANLVVERPFGELQVTDMTQALDLDAVDNKDYDVRFGYMPKEAYDRLPEHEGW